MSNTNRSDLAIEYVAWSELNEEDKTQYEKVTTIIKDRKQYVNILNKDYVKPKIVVSEIEKNTGIKLTTSHHAYLWKAFFRFNI